MKPAMSVPRAPSLRIQLDTAGTALTLIDAKDREYVVPCQMADSNAAQYRKAIKRGLDNLKQCVDAEKPTVKDAMNALGVLNTRGLSLISDIFGAHRWEVVERFQECFGAWRTQKDPAVLTITAALSRLIPLELLPLFDLAEWPKVADWETLESSARRFPGFSAIIRREFPDVRVSQNRVLDSDPRLPVKCFTYLGLKAAEEEVGFFQRNAGRRGGIDFHGPWPKREYDADEFVSSLARHLRYADRSFTGKYRAAADQIQHFVCHCEIDDEVANDSRLLFSAGNIASITELQARFALMKEPDGSKDGPLVFLNACGTSRMDPMAVASFPRFFLQQNSNRGFIGTETNVPDAFAAEFAQRFYQGLLGGLPLGEAIHWAKWAMLRDKNSPLGILYVVYADPDLQVSKAAKVVR
jgi:hypothetical protein